MAGIHSGQSYREIGLSLNMSEHTVRATVNQAAQKIDGFPELPPRWRVLAYTKFHEWQATQAAAVPKAVYPGKSNGPCTRSEDSRTVG